MGLPEEHSWGITRGANTADAHCSFVISKEEQSAFGQTFPFSDAVKPVLQCCLRWSNLGTCPGPLPALDCVSVSVCVLLQIHLKSPFLKLFGILI